MTFKRVYYFLVATLLLAAPVRVQADDPVTHHFDIDRPHGSVIVNEPVTFTIKAITENGKVNKSANHKAFISVTSGSGARAMTTRFDGDFRRGVCEITLTIKDAGQNIFQVA